MVLRDASSNDDAFINMLSTPMPAEQIISDSFYSILSGVLPLFMLLIFILPVYNVVSGIVKEKEARTKESMRMMGMGDLAYWFSWFVFYSTISTVIITIAWGILCINVIGAGTNVMYVWLYFFLYGESLFGQILVF